MAVPPLFSDEFPAPSSQRELEAAFRQYPDYDRYYVASGCIPDRRHRFEKLWASYHPYADSHFLKQFKANFNDRTWEMYLGCVLLEHGLELGLPRDHGPDLQVISPADAWIEAVAAARGAGRDAVPDLLQNSVSDYPEHQLLLRLMNSVSAKLNQCRRYLQDAAVTDDVPYVIAVNGGGLQYVESVGMPLMLKCAFGIGYLAIPLSSQRGEQPFWTRRASITKLSGAEVSLGFFADEAYAPISGVIYSPTDVLNHPSAIGGDCIIIHNPMARNPLPDEMFGFLEQWCLENEELRRVPRRV